MKYTPSQEAAIKCLDKNLQIIACAGSGKTEVVAHRVATLLEELPEVRINPKDTPPDVHVRPVVGGQPEAIMTLGEFRKEWPLLKTAFFLAEELLDSTNPGAAADLGIGPTFDELLELSRRFLDSRVRTLEVDGQRSDPRDVGIYYWRRQVVDVLENAVRGAGVQPVPILGSPDWLDSATFRRFQWTGVLADGKRCHTNKVACHTELEKRFAEFLDRAADVVRYFKNERFGFSVTYYEGNRPRQYYPDFIVVARETGGREVTWLAETKGEIRPNTALKQQAAESWCQKMSLTRYGSWRYLFVQQKKFERALSAGPKTFEELVKSLAVSPPEKQLKIVSLEDYRVKKEAFKSLLLVYTLKAAAGYFGNSEAIEPLGWVEVKGFGTLDDRMFVAQAVGRSMEPKIYDGDYLVFRANPVGSRIGKIVLVQYRGPADPETGGSYTVKKYDSEKVPDGEGGWKHGRIVLSPLNPDYTQIVLEGIQAEFVRVIGEYLAKVKN